MWIFSVDLLALFQVWTSKKAFCAYLLSFHCVLRKGALSLLLLLIYSWAILGMVSLIRSKDQTTGANNCSFPPFYLERAITPEYISKGKGDFLFTFKLICFCVVETNYFKHISLYTRGQHEKRYLTTEWSFSEEFVPSAKRLNWSSFFP